MPDLDFGESDEEAILVLKGFAHRVNTDLYNHGTKGLLTTFNAFVIQHETREQERAKAEDEKHRQNSAKINLLLTLATIGLLIVGAVSIFVTVEVSRHSQLDPARIFHSRTNPVLSYFKKAPQYAGGEGRIHY